jgi:hypothetical protein
MIHCDVGAVQRRLGEPQRIGLLLAVAVAVSVAGIVSSFFVDTEAPAPPRAIYVPAGGPWIDGMVVPTGTRLVGAPFEDRQWAHSITTVFDVVANPFAAWDDLASQANARGWSLPHSAVCQWDLPNPAATISVTKKPVRPPTALVCDQTASRVGPAAPSMSALLGWGYSATFLTVTISDDPGYSLPDPGPVSQAASRWLPAVIRPTAPKVGDPLGSLEASCAEHEHHFLLPRGARYLGTDGFYVILAVADAHAAMKRIIERLDDRGGEGKYTLRAEAGEWSLAGSLPGSGSCDGRSYAHGSLIWLDAAGD